MCFLISYLFSCQNPVSMLFACLSIDGMESTVRLGWAGAGEVGVYRWDFGSLVAWGRGSGMFMVLTCGSVQPLNIISTIHILQLVSMGWVRTVMHAPGTRVAQRTGWNAPYHGSAWHRRCGRLRHDATCTARVPVCLGDAVFIRRAVQCAVLQLRAAPRISTLFPRGATRGRLDCVTYSYFVLRFDTRSIHRSL